MKTMQEQAEKSSLNAKQDKRNANLEKRMLLAIGLIFLK